MADDGIGGGGDTPTGEPPAATRRSSAARPEAPIRHHGAHAGPDRGVEDLPRRSPRLLRLAALAAAGRGRHRLARRIRLRHRLPARRREHPALPAALPRLGNRMGLCALPGQHGDLPRHPATRRQPYRHPRTSPRLRPRPLPRLPDRLDQPPDGLTRCCTRVQQRSQRSSRGSRSVTGIPPGPSLGSTVRASRRDLALFAVVAMWVPLVLVADVGVGVWTQRALGAGTWALLLVLMRSESPRTRAQVAIVVGYATVIEYTCSPLLGAYTYRLHNVPAFVPPAATASSTPPRSPWPDRCWRAGSGWPAGGARRGYRVSRQPRRRPRCPRPRCAPS